MPTLAHLAGRTPVIMKESGFSVSAVLLPLIENEGDTHLLFEIRSHNLATQPGEICFPGGQVEDGEQGKPLEAAVRETMEELGLAASDIEVVAPLDILPTPAGGIVYPWVGRILTHDFHPNPAEVEEVFTAPLSYFQARPPQMFDTEVITRFGSGFPRERIPMNYRYHLERRWSVSLYFYEYGKYTIWGMTAKILYHFLQVSQLLK